VACAGERSRIEAAAVPASLSDPAAAPAIATDPRAGSRPSAPRHGSRVSLPPYRGRGSPAGVGVPARSPPDDPPERVLRSSLP
jgi:hypothetical protein